MLNEDADFELLDAVPYTSVPLQLSVAWCHAFPALTRRTSDQPPPRTLSVVVSVVLGSISYEQVALASPQDAGDIVPTPQYFPSSHSLQAAPAILLYVPAGQSVSAPNLHCYGKDKKGGNQKEGTCRKKETFQLAALIVAAVWVYIF